VVLISSQLFMFSVLVRKFIGECW